MQGLGTYAIARAAPDHVRDFWLSRAANGKAIARFRTDRTNAGSMSPRFETTARRDGETYVIDGRKRFISNAGIADFYTVFAKTGTREDGRPVLSAFVVSSKMQGFRVSNALADSAASNRRDRIQRVSECGEDMVGQEGDGFKLAMETMDTFRASVGARPAAWRDAHWTRQFVRIRP
jgi:alkylation response protein AidB-like acyl-CoA dehydrogenase